MKNIDFLFKIDKANKELQQVINYLESIEHITDNYINLKLYDAFFTTETEEETELFYNFCDCSFEELKEFIQERANENIYNLMHYIGRTSNFYCLTDSLYNSTSNMKMHEKICNLFYDFYGRNNIILDFTEENKIDTIQLLKDCEKYDQDKHDSTQLDYIISGEFLKDIKTAFEDCILLYDTIKDFKENQISFFEEYKENYI